MSTKMRVLIIEDNPADAELLTHHLKKSGLDYNFAVISTESEFVTMCQDFVPDIILSDYSLPQFSGLRALELRAELAPDVPFILVTGPHNEETAVNIMKAGADDYLLKDNLSRLIPAINSAIEKQRNIRLKKRAEVELAQSTEKFRAAFACASVGIALVNLERRFFQVNKALCSMLGYEEGELLKKSFEDLTYEHDLSNSLNFFNLLVNHEVLDIQFEKRYIHKDGSLIWVHLSITMVSESPESKPYFITHFQDISSRKRTEEALEKRLLALTNPLSEAKELKFEALFSLSEIQKIQDAFAEAMDVSSVIIGTDGQYITKPSNYNCLCSEMVQQTEIGAADCLKTHQEFVKDTSASIKYRTCDGLGILLGKTAIYAGDKLIASWIIGQVLDESQTLESRIPYAKKIGVPEDTFLEALSKMKSMSEEKFEKICKSVQMVSDQLSKLALQNMHQAQLITDMKTFDERFKRAQQIGNVGNWEIDLKTKMVWASEEAYKIYGVDKSAGLLTLDFIQKIVENKYREVLDNALNRLIEYDEPYDQIFAIHRKSDGQIRFVHSKALVSRDPENKPLKIEGVIQDIHEQKRAEDALKESESRFWNLFNDAPIGYHEFDLQGRIVLVNQTELDMLGYEIEEMIGRYIWVFSWDTEISKDRVKEKLLKNCPLDQNRDYQLRKKDGSFLDVSIQDKYLLDESGKIIGIRTTIQDITLKKQAEASLKESEQRFRAIFEQAAVGVAIVSAITSDYLLVNDKYCDITGLVKADIMLNGIAKLTYIEDLPTELERMEELLSGKCRSFSLEKRLIMHNGALRWINLTVSPMWPEGSSPTSYIRIIEDISDRKKAEIELLEAKEKAEEMSRLKTSFLANMSHELRTPLMGILGYSEILTVEPPNEATESIANVIHQSGARLLETLNLILDLSRIEAGKLPMHLTKVDIVQVIKELCALFFKNAKKKNLRLEIVTSLPSLYTWIDERMLREAIANLVNNGIKYTQQGGVIVSIKKVVEQEIEFAEIAVQDTGIGIASEHHHLIFDEFRQVSEGFGRTFEGTGLGLSITKNFIDKLQGTIRVESKVGEGSTFVVRLPIRDLNKDKSKEHDTKRIQQKPVLYSPEQQSKSAVKPDVLYIEDDPIAVDLVKRTLRLHCSIDAAFNARDGLMKAESKTYTAILMDINLGTGMDGVEATKRIRKISLNKDTPIVALTAFAMDSDETEFLNAGCTYYLSKPFRRDELVALMTKIFAD